MDMEPELVCVNSLGESAGLGVLSSDGFMFTVPLHHIRKYTNYLSSYYENFSKLLFFFQTPASKLYSIGFVGKGHPI